MTTAAARDRAILYSASFFAGAGLKLLYDGLLFRGFRRLRPPEEEL